MKIYPAVIVLLFCFPVRATTVVVAVTPTGIVIGADGKGYPTGTICKIHLLKQRLIVADIYLESVERKDDGAKLYDFQTWVKKIDSSAENKVSVSALTDLIKDQMTATFAFAIDQIKNGSLTKEKAASSGIDTYLIQYVIAGYEKGVPTVYSVTLMPDWGSKTAKGPFVDPLKELKGQKPNSHILWRGQGLGIQPVFVTETEEHKDFAARVPVECRALQSDEDLTLNQASNVVRSLLGIEAKANPVFVGFPITVVTVPKAGHGFVRIYKADDSPLSALPASRDVKRAEK